MQTTLSLQAINGVRTALRQTNEKLAAWYPGERAERQPVHTVYGGAHLFRADSAKKLGLLALKALDEYAPDATALAEAVNLEPRHLAATVYARVREKLQREAVEDFRIDFEDGYGNRHDEEEDGHAVSAAREVAQGLAGGALPSSIGIRVKPFSEELKDRSIRTLDLFLTTLVGESAGRLPDGFVVTLPKVTTPDHVSALAQLFDLLEPPLGLPPRSLRLEIMIETTQSILDHRGSSNLPLLVEAARGRCSAVHFGTYDYTAGCNITAAHQQMTHPACDFAKHMMQVALAGTGVWLSDGATNVMPVGPHRSLGGRPLSDQEVRENHRAVRRAWKLHYDHVRHSLINAYYQGWDLHPAQLPTRYAAVYAFFLDGFAAASDRLRNFLDKAAQATLIGEVFDDAATGQGLLNYFLRAVNCGAVTEREAVEMSGLTMDQLRTRSFVKILKLRR